MEEINNTNSRSVFAKFIANLSFWAFAVSLFATGALRATKIIDSNGGMVGLCISVILWAILIALAYWLDKDSVGGE